VENKTLKNFSLQLKASVLQNLVFSRKAETYSAKLQNL